MRRPSWSCGIRLYGVNHGELFLRWRAEGDPEFAATITASFEWKETANDMTEHERNVDLSTVNQLADSDMVHSLLMKRCEMRERLDLVHARLGLPILDSAGTEADWDSILTAEGQLMHVEYGLNSYAAHSQPDSGPEDDEACKPRRYARVATGNVMMTSYFRILRDTPAAPMDTVDRPLVALLKTANHDAFLNPEMVLALP
ncbi:hypothetical protein PR001_g21724 [Phytophthora rubi]|uniref:Uncharacterized protein n=1 Tax=Phytophthora rubi TaxID=129364 RepID=A0A6A3J792_9STRA|nr:hypothetical protein PR002_g22545 [Phytophthora rubi]KAE8989637.1 hypothetical protein PR001_g21724 [Phytophthora rubi]